jgi:hypothetical protein
MALLGVFKKQPRERKDYDITFEDELTDGDNVQSCTVTPDINTITVDAVYINDPRVKIWIEGGVHGVAYTFTAVATTADGRVLEGEFKITVKET